MKRIAEFLDEAIAEMQSYIDGNEHDELEKHDCRIAKEAYEHVRNFVCDLMPEPIANGIAETKAQTFEIIIKSWNYPVSSEPSVTKLEDHIFKDKAEAENFAILDAFRCAEDFNFGKDDSDAEETPIGERLLFRVDLDAEDCVAVIRVWDGDDYYNVLMYEVVSVNDKDDADEE